MKLPARVASTATFTQAVVSAVLERGRVRLPELRLYGQTTAYFGSPQDGPVIVQFVCDHEVSEGSIVCLMLGVTVRRAWEEVAKVECMKLDVQALIYTREPDDPNYFRSLVAGRDVGSYFYPLVEDADEARELVRPQLLAGVENLYELYRECFGRGLPEGARA